MSSEETVRSLAEVESDNSGETQGALIKATWRNLDNRPSTPHSFIGKALRAPCSGLHARLHAPDCTLGHWLPAWHTAQWSVYWRVAAGQLLSGV